VLKAMKYIHIPSILKTQFTRNLRKNYSVALSNDIVMVESNLMPLHDSIILFGTIKSLAPKIVLEIGTYFGNTTLGLYKNSPLSQIYTIDTYKEMGLDIPDFQDDNILPKKQVGMTFKKEKTRIKQIFGDSRKFKTYSHLKNKKPDFVLIDGNHSMEAVIKDTQNVLRLVKPKSIIFWHDFMTHPYEIPEALCYITAKYGLKIFHIKNTWLAYSIL
jgi:hypothetical protein